VEPTGEQQPAFASHQIPRCSSFAEELSSPHLIHGLSRMLQNVKLVVDDPALGHPFLQALPEWFPECEVRFYAELNLALSAFPMQI